MAGSSHRRLDRARSSWARGFPPAPASFRGRARELGALVAIVRRWHPTAIAITGGGGSGKSVLAAAVGHRVRRTLGHRLVWVRTGAWDSATVMQMLALQLGERPERDPTRAVRRALGERDTFAVLDNHEDDASTAAILEALRGLPVTWLVTARRCLLGGVTVLPLAPALVVEQRSPFPAVASLTRLLRWNPVALDLADALVRSGAVDVETLEQRLRERGVERIAPIEHEDDVPEVRALSLEALEHVSPASRRILGVLAHQRGDHVDQASLAQLARAKSGGASSMRELRALRLVQEPVRGRFALHATVRHALRRVLALDEARVARHYLALFEAHPTRLDADPSQLFALMDWAQSVGDVGLILRVTALATAWERVG